MSQRLISMQFVQNLSKYGCPSDGLLFGRQVRNHCTPQCRLPRLVSRHDLVVSPRIAKNFSTLCPSLQPVTAVDLVLIEEVRETLGQLQKAFWLPGP